MSTPPPAGDELVQRLRAAADHPRMTYPCAVGIVLEAADRIAALEAVRSTREGEIERLTQALKDVCDPLGKIKRDAEASGDRLSGMAYSIANDLHFVKGIARQALNQGTDR